MGGRALIRRNGGVSPPPGCFQNAVVRAAARQGFAAPALIISGPRTGPCQWSRTLRAPFDRESSGGKGITASFAVLQCSERVEPGHPIFCVAVSKCRTQTEDVKDGYKPRCMHCSFGQQLVRVANNARSNRRSVISSVIDRCCWGQDAEEVIGSKRSSAGAAIPLEDPQPSKRRGVTSQHP